MNFKALFSQQFLFSSNFIAIEAPDKAFFLVGLCAAAIAVVLKAAQIKAPTPPDKKYRAKLFNLFCFVGLGEIFWFGLRYQNVRFFGTRFVAMLVLFITLIWLGVLAVKMAVNYGAEKQAWEKEQVRLKYLPK